MTDHHTQQYMLNRLHLLKTDFYRPNIFLEPIFFTHKFFELKIFLALKFFLFHNFLGTKFFWMNNFLIQIFSDQKKVIFNQKSKKNCVLNWALPVSLSKILTKPNTFDPSLVLHGAGVQQSQCLRCKTWTRVGTL